ncbi:AB-hydrolase YheT [Rhodofomes roseus]|uniref:AB-hydrolase YheT n=1 Tax=Rhodofomes roseus TaxID=34475 RepID=A0ABQ8K9L4_9APHY|nr:AB-hydrolase YheT [Rhodofomes roseus]KAH9834040.1 AB-hydrolase YheT [Rhodofomes roseus]
MLSSILLALVVVGLGVGVALSLGRDADYYRPVLYCAKATEDIEVLQSSGNTETKVETLGSLIEHRCPSISRHFKPIWWLFSGHLQTAYSVVGDFSKVDTVEYERTLLRTLDGGTLGLDFTPPESVQKLPDDTPIIVVLHGLTGGSHESYVRAVVSPACMPIEDGGLGYRAIVVNFRGCAGVPVTSPQLYSAGHTGDIRAAMYYIRRRYPHALLLGLGFSLGANVLTRYVAEEGEDCRLAAACVIACPWDLVTNSEALEGNWFHRHVYSKALGSNLQAIVKQHAAGLSTPPSHPVAQAVAPTLALRSPTLETFDETFNRIAGGSSPPFPFPSARAYYAWASSHAALPRVRVPFLAIAAEDDPIVQVLPVHAGRNGCVAFAVTKKGGHLGWFERGADGTIGRWFTRPVLEWLKAVGSDMVVRERPGKPLEEVDGFLMEVGRDNVGCKQVEGGGRVIGTEGEEGLLAGL